MSPEQPFLQLIVGLLSFVAVDFALARSRQFASEAQAGDSRSRSVSSLVFGLAAILLSFLLPDSFPLAIYFGVLPTYLVVNSILERSGRTKA